MTFLYPDMFCKTWHHYQYGIAQLSACLKQAGHTTDLIHMNEPVGREEFIADLQRRGTEVLALSTTSGQFPYVMDPIRWAREDLKDLHVIAGGIHPTLAPQDTMDAVPVHAVAVGECEEAIVEYVDALQAGRDRSSIANFWVRKENGEIARNLQRPLLEELDRLPMCDHDIFDFRHILSLTCGEASVMATRGCPFRCAYCSNEAKLDIQAGLGDNMRYRSAKSVLDEICHIRDTYDAKSMYFIDDIFTMNREWLAEFCEEYGKRCKLPFKIQIQVKTVDYERLAMMKEVGLYSIVVGVESGDPEIRRKVLAKRISNDDIRRVFCDADSLGIETGSYNIIGIPGETEESIQRSIDFNREINPNRSIISIFTPFPGTSLYDECVREGLVEHYTKASYFDRASFLKIPGISQERLIEMHDEFVRSALEISEKKTHRGYFNFLANLERAHVNTQNEDYVYITAPRIDSVERKSVCSHPFSELRYGLKLREGSRLRFGIAMDPSVWDPEKGSGVIFRVELRSGLRRQKLFEKAIDPKRIEDDRHWFNEEVDLSRWGGKSVKLYFSTHAAGDRNDFCSSYWAEPHLVAA
ncbi:MAG: radical SAM protein [Chrysiogenetes bacterium]|nr:radical SAM protein [Chrysiogenetes bacterium]